MTVTLGISAMITLFLYILPLGLWNRLRVNYPNLQQFGWMILVPVNLSSVANVFLFAKRHVEIRMAIKALFACESLPEQTQDWQRGTVKVVLTSTGGAKRN